MSIVSARSTYKPKYGNKVTKTPIESLVVITSIFPACSFFCQKEGSFKCSTKPCIDATINEQLCCVVFMIQAAVATLSYPIHRGNNGTAAIIYFFCSNPSLWIGQHEVCAGSRVSRKGRWTLSARCNQRQLEQGGISVGHVRLVCGLCMTIAKCIVQSLLFFTCFLQTRIFLIFCWAVIVASMFYFLCLLFFELWTRLVYFCF